MRENLLSDAPAKRQMLGHQQLFYSLKFRYQSRIFQLSSNSHGEIHVGSVTVDSVQIDRFQLLGSITDQRNLVRKQTAHRQLAATYSLCLSLPSSSALRRGTCTVCTRTWPLETPERRDRLQRPYREETLNQHSVTRLL